MSMIGRIGVVVRRGIVWIAPVDSVPPGRMLDPADGAFWASWQDDVPLEDTEFVGAEAAITWGLERAERVLIRLGHTPDTYFSAGSRPDEGFPPWPPKKPATEGWWSASDAPVLEEQASASGEWQVEFHLKLSGDRPPQLTAVAAAAFEHQIAEAGPIRTATCVGKADGTSIRVRATLRAGNRGEAEQLSNAILNAARSAAGREIRLGNDRLVVRPQHHRVLSRGAVEALDVERSADDRDCRNATSAKADRPGTRCAAAAGESGKPGRRRTRR